MSLNSFILRMLLPRFANYLRRHEFYVTEDRTSFSYLKKYKFDIATFIDIGVYKGTPTFYKLFSKNKIVLIDPLPGVMERVKPLISGMDYIYLPLAAGSNCRSMTLSVSGPSSSLLPRRGHKATEQVSVSVVPLDNIVREHNLIGPFGIKIDTEGFDLEVIRGASETLKNTTFVFSEVSLRRRFDGNYRFSEFVAEMAQNGFEIAEITTHFNHNRFADVLFVRWDSPSLDVGAIQVRLPGQGMTQ